MSKIICIFAHRNKCALTALLACLLIRLDCRAQTSGTSVFNTIGDGYKKPVTKVALPDSVPCVDDDIDDEMGEDDMINPPSDSISAYIPMVSLPLRSILVTSPFGMRRDPMKNASKREQRNSLNLPSGSILSNHRRRQMHNGIDLRARYEQVFSMLPGTVTAVAFSTNGGYYVTVNHGVCVCSYLHLSKILVNKGQRVRAGQAIAISGNTGRRTTGPHLHLSCRWGEERGKYFNPMVLIGFVSNELKMGM